MARACLVAWAIAAPAVVSAQDDATEATPGAEAPAADESGPPGDPAAIDEARRHYAQGVVFFRADRFEEAIAEFDEAYALWPNPTILYSLGQAHERLLRVPRAIDAYRRFLEASPADDPRRAQVEDTIRGLETILATLVVESEVPARVIANGEDVGAAPGTVVLATGRYDIEVRAPGYVSHRETIALAARTERRLVAALEREPEPTIVVQRSGLEPTWFYAGVALTGAAAITAGILGGVTLDAASRYDAAPFRTAAMRDEGQRLAIATDVMIGTTAVFAIATLVVAMLTDWAGAPADVRASGAGLEVALR